MSLANSEITILLHISFVEGGRGGTVIQFMAEK